MAILVDSKAHKLNAFCTMIRPLTKILSLYVVLMPCENFQTEMFLNRMHVN